MQPKLLKLVPYEHPILRKQTQTIKFPLSQDDRQTIADMLYSILPEQLRAADAPWDAAVGMAANQWGIDKSIFIYCPYGNDKEREVVINPSYTPVMNILLATGNQEDDWEGCFSVPLATGHVRRYKTIRVKYQNENGDVIEKELTEWLARVWQHENDHLNGFLYDCNPKTCLEKHAFKTESELEAFYGVIREQRRQKMEPK